MVPKIQILLIGIVLWSLSEGLPVPEVGEPAKISPVIFIPGKGGCQIEAKIDRDPRDSIRSDCVVKQDWTRIWLDVWQFLWPGQNNCWAENVKLHYNRTTRRSTPPQGIEFRVPGFGDTNTVEYIDDSWAAYMMGNLGSYLVHVVTALKEWGYERGKSIRAAPYDFRFAPHSQMDYFERLRKLVEETYDDNDQSKVTIFSHSMGGIYGLYFLHTVPQDWKDKYINAYVPVNAPWKGTTLISNLYTSGYNWGIAPLSREIVRMQQQSWETGVLLLPQADAWGPNDVLVKTPEREYTANDYGDYFRDIHHPIGKEMFDNIQHESYDMSHPAVDTYCVYSYGLDTPDHLVYEEGEFPYGHATMELGPGDGTVNLRSLEYCKEWLEEHDQHHAADVKTFKNVPHIDLIWDKDFLTFFKEVIAPDA